MRIKRTLECVPCGTSADDARWDDPPSCTRCSGTLRRVVDVDLSAAPDPRPRRSAAPTEPLTRKLLDADALRRAHEIVRD